MSIAAKNSSPTNVDLTHDHISVATHSQDSPDYSSNSSPSSSPVTRLVYRASWKARSTLSRLSYPLFYIWDSINFSDHDPREQATPSQWRHRDAFRRFLRISRFILKWFIILVVTTHTLLFIIGRDFIPIGDLSYLEPYDWRYEWPPTPLAKDDPTVTVDVYDIRPGWGHLNKFLLKFKLGAFHTEINVYNIVFRHARKQPRDDEENLRKDLEDVGMFSKMPYHARFNIGVTDWSYEAVDRMRNELHDDFEIFQFRNHEVFQFNCNDLSRYVADRLGLGDVWPMWIDDLPKGVGYYFPFKATLFTLEDIAIHDVGTYKNALMKWLSNDVVEKRYYLRHQLHFNSPNVKDRWNSNIEHHEEEQLEFSQEKLERLAKLKADVDSGMAAPEKLDEALDTILPHQPVELDALTLPTSTTRSSL